MSLKRLGMTAISVLGLLVPTLTLAVRAQEETPGPGSGLLDSLDHARAEAARIGYPVMLKSTAGGGGIGMRMCPDEAALVEAFESVKRMAASAFGFFRGAVPIMAADLSARMFQQATPDQQSALDALASEGIQVTPVTELTSMAGSTTSPDPQLVESLPPAKIIPCDI